MTQAPTPAPAAAAAVAHSNQPWTADSIEPFSEQYGDSYQDILTSPGHGPEQQHFSTTPSDVDFMMEDYFATPISLQIPELADDSSRTGSIINDWSAQSQLLDPNITAPLFDTSAFNFFAATQPLSASPHPSTSMIPGHEFTFGSESSPVNTHCGCLPRVLELLKQLCTAAPVHCTAWSGQKPERGSGSAALLQSMIAENQYTLDAVGKMLPCPCSQDGFLLTTICLVVLKVMGRYEAAARSPSRSATNSSSAGSVDEDMTQFTASGNVSAVIGCYSVEGEDFDRMGAQVVLSELHRVQRLIKGLSERLNVAGLNAKDDTTSHSTRINSDAGAVAGQQDILMSDSMEAALPFYAPFFCQLESDLRKRLRKLSEQTAELVRRA